jgi:WD40 repeat protein
MLAACLADTGVAVYKTPQYLYSAPEQHDSVSPFCERSVLLDGEKGYRIWSTRFLSDGLLALGLGPSSKPIHVYQVTADGLSKDPIRKLGIDGTAWGCDDRVESTVPEAEKTSSAVYPIIPLPWSASAGHAPGEIFLSGCYDGIVRLHDMRCPTSYESSYFDPTDDGAIYSLQTLGRERLAAGSSRHSIIRFFDLRVSGGRTYHYTDVGSSPDSPKSKDTSKKSGWNLFLNPRNNINPTSSRWQRSRATESPVYSLSSPSATSPTLFAGVENNVVELDFISMLDKHPDPIFAHGLARDQRGNINIVKSWNPKGDVLNFAMYDHSKTGFARLRTQAGIGKYTGVIDGLDERWRESS